MLIKALEYVEKGDFIFLACKNAIDKWVKCFTEVEMKVLYEDIFLLSNCVI